MLNFLNKANNKLLQKAKTKAAKYYGQRQLKQIGENVEDMIKIMSNVRPKCESGFTFEYKTLREYSEAIGGRIDSNLPDQINEDRFVLKFT